MSPLASYTRQRQVAVNGLHLHVTEQGAGPLVVFLHGFPDLGLGWRRQLPAVAGAGFHAAAPDLRGYGRSAMPEGTAAYRAEALAADVAALVEALGARDAAVVGHDWGGVVAWYVAMLHPERVRRLAILNAPHPAVYRRALRSASTQALRSWYAAFFQLPWLPEAALRLGNRAVLRRVWAEGPAAEPTVRALYHAAFADPERLRAALAYYRAAVRYPAPRPRPVACPTLVLWGDRDRYLVPALADGLGPWAGDLRVEHFPEAGHWLHHEAPDAVNERLVAFLNEG